MQPVVMTQHSKHTCHNQTNTNPYSDHKNTCPDTRTHLTHALAGLHNALHGFWRELPDNNTKKASQLNKDAKISNLNKKKQKKRQNKNVDSWCIATDAEEAEWRSIFFYGIVMGSSPAEAGHG